MKVDIKFKPDSSFKAGGKVHFENAKEIHFNYNNQGRVAIEEENSGCTYEIKWIEEFEITE